jgi:copper chaperone CopZ
MFANKYLTVGYLSVISVIFGIVMSVSFVKAAPSSQSDDAFAQSNIKENFSTSRPYELAEGKVEEESLKEEEIEEIELNIKGMTCGKCEGGIKAALMGCYGVKDAKVSHEKANAVLKVNVYEADYDELIGAVEKAGFSVVEED